MLKRNGQFARHAVPRFSGRLTDSELQAYNEALAAHAADLDNLSAQQAALTALEQQTVQLAAERVETVSEQVDSMVIGSDSNNRWRVRSRLLSRGNREVLLCQKEGERECAIVQRLAEGSASANNNGASEILLTGNSPSLLVQDYLQNERQALLRTTRELLRRIEADLVSHHPEQNLTRVFRAFSERLGIPKEKVSERVRPQVHALKLTNRRGVHI